MTKVVVHASQSESRKNEKLLNQQIATKVEKLYITHENDIFLTEQNTQDFLQDKKTTEIQEPIKIQEPTEIQEPVKILEPTEIQEPTKIHESSELPSIFILPKIITQPLTNYEEIIPDSIPSPISENAILSHNLDNTTETDTRFHHSQETNHIQEEEFQKLTRDGIKIFATKFTKVIDNLNYQRKRKLRDKLIKKRNGKAAKLANYKMKIKSPENPSKNINHKKLIPKKQINENKANIDKSLNKHRKIVSNTNEITTVTNNRRKVKKQDFDIDSLHEELPIERIFENVDKLLSYQPILPEIQTTEGINHPAKPNETLNQEKHEMNPNQPKQSNHENETETNNEINNEIETETSETSTYSLNNLPNIFERVDSLVHFNPKSKNWEANEDKSISIKDPHKIINSTSISTNEIVETERNMNGIVLEEEEYSHEEIPVDLIFVNAHKLLSYNLDHKEPTPLESRNSRKIPKTIGSNDKENRYEGKQQIQETENEISETSTYSLKDLPNIFERIDSLINFNPETNIHQENDNLSEKSIEAKEEEYSKEEIPVEKIFENVEKLLVDFIPVNQETKIKMNQPQTNINVSESEKEDIIIEEIIIQKEEAENQKNIDKEKEEENSEEYSQEELPITPIFNKIDKLLSYLPVYSEKKTEEKDNENIEDNEIEILKNENEASETSSYSLKNLPNIFENIDSLINFNPEPKKLEVRENKSESKHDQHDTTERENSSPEEIYDRNDDENYDEYSKEAKENEDKQDDKIHIHTNETENSEMSTYSLKNISNIFDQIDSLVNFEIKNNNDQCFVAKEDSITENILSQNHPTQNQEELDYSYEKIPIERIFENVDKLLSYQPTLPEIVMTEGINHLAKPNETPNHENETETNNEIETETSETSTYSMNNLPNIFERIDSLVHFNPESKNSIETEKIELKKEFQKQQAQSGKEDENSEMSTYSLNNIPNIFEQIDSLIHFNPESQIISTTETALECQENNERLIAISNKEISDHETEESEYTFPQITSINDKINNLLSYEPLNHVHQNIEELNCSSGNENFSIYDKINALLSFSNDDENHSIYVMDKNSRNNTQRNIKSSNDVKPDKINFHEIQRPNTEGNSPIEKVEVKEPENPPPQKPTPRRLKNKTPIRRDIMNVSFA
ncbi:hypothetical protein TRFO_14876 [Tritrichomonas foetus]|uniref:Uncharacterized protein n=1 Tax=Tritrichomonas foetus TaxID=1144522 RepID=A0A1J4KYA6_9EUKA|nr:hypothetical protein TRFO_14876 [Tritrichomonas foetus]|eukprot:OHT14694.1 hypothetical protein TRFO_14876 [Tritrichomonas foetus]